MSNSQICIFVIKGKKEKSFAIKCDVEENLAKIRSKLGNNVNKNIIFTLTDGTDIKIDSEEEFFLKDIIDDIDKKKKVIHMKNLEDENTIKYELYVNGKFVSEVESSPLKNLEEFKNQIEGIITKKGIFLLDKTIDIVDEENYIIDEISKGNKIYIKVPEKMMDKPNNKNANANDKNFTINIENMTNAPAPIVNNYPLKDCLLIEKVGNLDIYEYPKITFTKDELKQAIKILVIGPTGSGKTTLLNSYVNYLMGINYTDTFRYKIINEIKKINDSHSQTSEVTDYNIRAKDGRFYQIIDTPGFGDTKGIQVDEEITNKISDFFLFKTGEINAICLVLKSSDNRLAACQKYIFNCIFDLFGDDMKKVFLAMLTFCDAARPQVLNALLDENCLFSNFLFSLGEDWYFKFNNSGIFEKNEHDVLNVTYWNIGMDNFAKFTKKLNVLPKVSLDKTRRVLLLRSNLNKTIAILSRKLKEGLDKMDELKQIYKIIKDLKGDINDSRNYTKKIMVNKSKKVDCGPGTYMTTCLICTKTCHRDCYISDDDKKYDCSAMNWNKEKDISKRHCEYCPKKCLWNEHKNRPYEIIDYQEEQTVTLDYVKEKLGPVLGEDKFIIGNKTGAARQLSKFLGAIGR